MPSPYFFLHIPRTAGTTLNAILSQHFRPEETISVYDAEDYSAHKFHTATELTPIQFITGHLMLQGMNPPSIYGMPVQVLTLLREPIGRLFSEYTFLRTWQENHLYSLLNDNKISFQGYITSKEKLLRYRGKNFMTRCISGVDVGDQYYPEQALDKAKHNLEKVFAFVGIQERFMESLVMLGDLLGVQNMMHERRNALQKSAKQEFTPQDRHCAEELNKADMELYAFACELFEARVHEKESDFALRVQNLSMLNEKFQKISSLLQQRATRESSGHIQLPKEGPW